MNLTINSTFRPFTFDEMVKPFTMYKEAYEKAEQDYSTLLAQANEWKDIANRENSPQAYAMYKSFMDDLNSYVGDFSNNGLSLNTRRGLMSMKGRYSQDIVPIEKASKKLDELSAEQRKLSASNPNLMFDREFSNVSIDQMMENPNLSYRAIDGNDIYTKAAAITKAMSSRINSLNPAMKGQYWEIRNGFGEEAANKFLLDSNAIPELNQALNDLVSSYNVPDNLKERSLNYAKQGAISGMVANTSYQANKAYVNPVDAQKARDAHELFLMQTGKKPYRTDEEGTKHYMNTAAGVTWSVKADGTTGKVGTTSKGKGGKGSTPVNKDNLILDNTYIGKVYKDPNTGKHYRLSKDGTPILENEGSSWLKAHSASSSVGRIQKYERARLNRGSSNIQEIARFKIEDGKLKQIVDNTHNNTFNNMFTTLKNNNSVSPDLRDNTLVMKDVNYFTANNDSKRKGSDNKTAINNALEGTGLTTDDVEFIVQGNKVILKTRVMGYEEDGSLVPYTGESFMYRRSSSSPVSSNYNDDY